MGRNTYTTKDDIMSLAVWREEKSEDYNPGDIVTLFKKNRVERLLTNGWIEEPKHEEPGTYRVPLTAFGAAIINYFTPEEWRHLERTPGKYVQRVRERMEHEHTAGEGDWKIASVDGNEHLAQATCEICGESFTRRFKFVESTEQVA